MQEGDGTVTLHSSRDTFYTVPTPAPTERQSSSFVSVTGPQERGGNAAGWATRACQIFLASHSLGTELGLQGLRKVMARNIVREGMHQWVAKGAVGWRLSRDSPQVCLEHV